jgi:hypothetical protein
MCWQTNSKQLLSNLRAITPRHACLTTELDARRALRSVSRKRAPHQTFLIDHFHIGPVRRVARRWAPASPPRPPRAPRTQTTAPHGASTSPHLAPVVSAAPSVDTAVTATCPPVRQPMPRRQSCAPAPVAEDPPTNTGSDVVSRRTPKSQRIARVVQPLACFLCRGRKVVCGPPVNLSTGDRTCEYVAIRSFT